MAFFRVVTFFLIFGLIFMAASAPSVSSFRPLAVAEVAVSEEAQKAVVQDMVATKDDERRSNRSSWWFKGGGRFCKGSANGTGPFTP